MKKRCASEGMSNAKSKECKIFEFFQNRQSSYSSVIEFDGIHIICNEEKGNTVTQRIE